MKSYEDTVISLKLGCMLVCSWPSGFDKLLCTVSDCLSTFTAVTRISTPFFKINNCFLNSPNSIELTLNYSRKCMLSVQIRNVNKNCSLLLYVVTLQCYFTMLLCVNCTVTFKQIDISSDHFQLFFGDFIVELIV